MFKKESSFSSEIMHKMQDNLVARRVENKYSFDKVSKAVNLLNEAADIFDDAGFKVESEVITTLLETIASNGMKRSTTHEELTLHDLNHKEMQFFTQLPQSTKDMLKALLKKNDQDAFVREVKIMYEIHKPQVIEMQSILPKSEVIDMHDSSLLDDRSKKKV